MEDLVPWPGIEPGPPVLGVPSLTHWTTREVPSCIILNFIPSKDSPTPQLILWFLIFISCHPCLFYSTFWKISLTSSYRFHIKFGGGEGIIFLTPKSSFLFSNQSVPVLCLQYLCLLPLLSFQGFLNSASKLSIFPLGSFVLCFCCLFFVLLFLQIHVGGFP